MPKERFIAYPGCESAEDQQPVYGWAGWNHVQQAQALATLYQKRRTEEDWKKERLVPMLAGLLELVPWVKQWHNAPNDEFGGLRLGDYFETFLDAQCRDLGVTREELRGWRPEGKKRGRRAIWGGRAAVRSVLYMSATVAATHNPRIATLYQRLLAKGKEHKVALVACMRKLITILNAMMRERKA